VRREETMVLRRELDVGATITEEGVAKLKELIGVPLRSRQIWNTEVTRDNIKHWAWGIGDENPLFLDEEYAKKTRWGQVMAPPTFVNTFGEVPMDVGLPGLHGLWTEDRWEFLKPLKIGERITMSGTLAEVLHKRSAMAGEMVEEITEDTYINQESEIVASLRRYCRRYGRRVAKERGHHKAVKVEPYTPEQIEAIDEDYLKEEVRGADPRYWEDIRVGDDLGHVVKGPLTVTDLMAFQRGCFCSPFVRAHRQEVLYRKRHPRAATLNSLGIPDAPERVHWEAEFAKEAGTPAPFDYGWQRIAWAGHLLTNWMSDDAFIRSFHVQIRGLNFLGDTLWYRGKVNAKSEKDGMYLADCEFWSDNQREERPTVGWATIALPSKVHGPVVLSPPPKA